MKGGVNMAKGKKDEIKLDETNVDLTKPLEEQVSDQVEEQVNVETDEEIIEDTQIQEEQEDAEEEETTETDEEVKEVEETEEEETTEIETNEVLDLDNKPINEDVIKESEEVPANFVPAIPVQKASEEKIKVKNGRVYKELKNGIGIFADTGETFKI